MNLSLSHNKKIKLYATIFTFMALAGFLFFGNAESASADSCQCKLADGSWTSPVIQSPDLRSCNNYCISNGTKNALYKFGSSDWTKVDPNLIKAQGVGEALGGVPNAQFKTSDDTCGMMQWGTMPLNCLLLVVLRFVGWLLSIAASIFVWIVDVNVFKSIVNGPNIYPVWQNVRDVLNIAFILVLLYSAFCTILQIEKYSYKKLLLNLVIMALLVNFSFPITRFIIDVANSLMYTLIQVLLGDPGSKFGLLASDSQIGTIINQPVNGSSATMLLASIVFVFIMAITLLAIAILFLIRMVVLVILIIFSPLAFVATILPDASGYSSKWWDNLFKYSFFGPIMVFMLYVATALLAASKSTGSVLVAAASKQGTDPSLLASMAYFSVPIVVLWLGMGVAQSMSIAGAATVMGGAQKFIKGAGKKFSGYNAIKKQYDAFAGARKKREEAKAKNRFGGKVGDFANKAQDTVIAGIPGVGGAAKKRLAELEKKKIQEVREEWKKNGGATDTEIADALNSKDTAKRKAGAMEAAEKNGFTGLPQYKQALDAIKGDPVYEKLFESKIKEKHVKFAIDEEINRTGATTTPAKNVIYEKWVGNMNAEALSKQQKLHEDSDFHDYLWDEVLIKNNDTELISETAKKLNKKSRQAWKNASLI